VTAIGEWVLPPPQQQQPQPQQSLSFKTTKFQGKEIRLSSNCTPSVKILLTDDTQTILKVVGRMLKTNGHPIETALNGSQALEKMKSSYVDNDIDVLLTDLQMPGDPHPPFCHYR
jgi:PleD family two-component response regulator